MERLTVDRAVSIEFALIAVVMSLALYRFAITLADPDLWGHVKFGEMIWKTGHIVIPDPFSYLTAGRRWFNHEWLTEVIFYLVLAAAGSTGLILLKMALGVGVIGSLYRHLARQGLNALRAGPIVVAVIYFLLPFVLTVRPQIFSFALFLTVLLMIHQMSSGRPRWIWVVPLLFALWANLHGGFLAGLGILGIWSAAELASRWLSNGRDLTLGQSAQSTLFLLAACVLATLVNPYGLHLWSFLYATALGTRPDITEWQPIALTTAYGLVYATFVALAALGLAYSRRPRRRGAMAVLIVAALLPLVALRHTPLAALAIGVLAGEHIGDAWDRWLAARTPSRSLSHVSLERALLAAALCGSLLLVAFAVPRLSCISIAANIGGDYPARAVGLIRSSGVAANLAVDFEWGEYAIYHLGPRVKVSVDGRRETIYDAPIYAENLNFRFGHHDWSALLRNHDTQLALVRQGFTAFNLLQLEPTWRLIYRDSLAGLFARRGEGIADTIERTVPPALPPDGAGLCFP
jgi:hypothetical protein